MKIHIRIAYGILHSVHTFLVPSLDILSDNKIHECNLNIHIYFLIMWSLKPGILITWNCNFQNFMGEKKKKNFMGDSDACY